MLDSLGFGQDARRDGWHDQPHFRPAPHPVGLTEPTPRGVQDTGEEAGARQRRRTGARRRARRSFGSVERLPSGQFRARVIGPDRRYVSAPATSSNRTDAALWVDLQRADLARGTWQTPVKPSVSPSVTAFVTSWIEEHPSARASTKELYRGLLRSRAGTE